jgi:ABC-2 type transport system permease protein
MPIYDQSYKHWDGTFKSHAFRWWVITKYGIKTAFKKKAVKLLLTFGLVLFMTVASGLYLYTNRGKLLGLIEQLSGGHGVQGFWRGGEYVAEIESDREPFFERLDAEGFQCQEGGQMIRILPPEGKKSRDILAVARETGTKITRLIPPGVPATFYRGLLHYPTFYLFLMLLIIGAGLIARDVKFNALQIYLAKPITGLDYIVGKLGVLVFFLLMVTLVPGIILFLFEAALVGDSLYLRYYWWVPAAICGYSLLIVLSGSLVTLAMSSLSRNVRNAAAGGAAVFWFTPMIGRMLQHATRNDSYMLISFRDNWSSVGNRIFGMEPLFDVSWGWSLLILSTVTVLCVAALACRVRGVEVVK